METPASSASQAPSSDQGPASAAVAAATEAGGTADTAISIQESQGTDTDVEIVDAKRRKLKSVVWKEFTRVQINGVWRAECMWCKDRLGG
ncbi:unnamed protein product, partial [Urochloa humidicola]